MRSHLFKTVKFHMIFRCAKCFFFNPIHMCSICLLRSAILTRLAYTYFMHHTHSLNSLLTIFVTYILFHYDVRAFILLFDFVCALALLRFVRCLFFSTFAHVFCTHLSIRSEYVNSASRLFSSDFVEFLFHFSFTCFHSDLCFFFACGFATWLSTF